MVYDMIVLGAGAAGLFAGASVAAPVRGLFLEKSASPGKKLLMSGAGQCNLTHGGDIADFVPHYGRNGSRIRPVLYRFNNRSVVDFFAARGVSLFEREDGKVFPVSLRARDVLDALLAACRSNGFEFRYSCAADGIVAGSDDHGPVFSVHGAGEVFAARKLVVATGGCSYPGTGSDGSIFPVLEKMGISVIAPKPALVPIPVRGYPYADLSGIAFPGVSVVLRSPEDAPGNASGASAAGASGSQRDSGSGGKKTMIAENSGDLLLTHTCFSGPAILDISRYASVGDLLSVDYLPSLNAEDILRDLKALAPGNRKQFVTVLSEYLSGVCGRLSCAAIPKRFLEAVCLRSGTDGTLNLSQLGLPALKAVISALKRDTYVVSGTGSFANAMATAGGVSLDEINIRTLESKKYPGLYFAGEALDVDGDTGGYNLQFAFSSGNLVVG